MRKRVVITGIGTVNPIGNNCKEAWDNCKKGVCGISPIDAFDTTNNVVKLAAQIKTLNVEDFIERKEAKRMDRFTQLAIIAAKEAMEKAGFSEVSADENQNVDAGKGVNFERCGVMVSSGIGGLGTIETEHSRGLSRGFEKVSPFFVPLSITNMAAARIAIKYGFRGMCSCVVTACASSTNAIGDAFHYIKDGYADVMVCGGAESTITELGVGGFASMKALSTATDINRASIPFDKERDGFVMGEGAGILVLEEYSHAIKRGATIYGEIAGYGASCDAYHMTAPAPDGSGAAICMRNALADAQITPEEIAYINAHGTSTHLNDAGETKAIHTTFAEHAKNLMVSSTKSMTGHMLGAAGAVEAIFSALALKDSFIPPTINYREYDEECDLDIVPNEGREAEITYAMSNSLGFGGHNASIILKKI